MVANMEQRRRRAANGSRRKRDLAAAGLQRETDRVRVEHEREVVEQRDREARLRPEIAASPAATAAWASTSEAIRQSVPESTFQIWFAPLTCLGEVKGALALAAPDRRRLDWVARKYRSLLGGAVRAKTDYRGAFLFTAPTPPPGDDEGML